MVTKVVMKDKSAAAVKSRKVAKNARRKNKGKLNAAAKRAYHTMTQKEKHAHLEQQVFTRAMRHGATEAEAKKAVMAYKKRRKTRLAGKHASGQTKAARAAQAEIRSNIRKQSSAVRDAHRAALAKIKSAGGTPQARSKMRMAEKKRYANDRSKLASLRKKAVNKHKTLLGKIKSKSGGAFRLQDFISNYSKTPISRKGKRLQTIGKNAAAAGVAAIGNKHFTVKGGVKRKNATKAPAAAAPAAAPVAKKRGRPAKAKPAETAAAAPVAKKRGRPAKAKPAETAAAPVAKKRGRPAKAKPAETAPAAPAAKKRGRPAGSKNKAKEAAAPAAKVAAKPAAKAAAKPAAKAAAKPAAKAAAKVAAKPAAKAAAKAVAKPVAKKEAAKVAAKVATKVAAKAAPKGKAVPAKTGGAKPKNKRASLS